MKRLFISFIKDRLLYASGYFISLGLIMLYFHLTLGDLDWLYPAVLTLFIFVLTSVMEWVRYYKFHVGLEKSAEEEFYELHPETCEQRAISEAIKKLHQKYTEEISRINMEGTNKQHFLSQWIHNMKTPVSVIGLILEKARESEVLDIDHIKDIEEENNRLHNSLEQVLNTIRMEEFFRDYEPEVVNLVDSLKEAINSRKSQFIYSNVFPRLRIEEESIPVITDSKWNKFMLDQIISNSIKYSQNPQEKKYITFSVSRAGGNVVLEIKDEGVGIPEHDLNRVFEPFFTGENGRKFKNSTGIGLYISSRIAEKLGHCISIESELKVGTKVKITYLAKL
jgi:two-component system, OmpR family, sensor histidine kinase YxdK